MIKKFVKFLRDLFDLKKFKYYSKNYDELHYTKARSFYWVQIRDSKEVE